MYEIKLSVRATKQSKKLDTHLKELIKRKIKKALASDPYKYPLLSGKYSGLRKVVFSTPGGEFRAVYTIREDKKRIIIAFAASRENFYKELRRYLS